MRNSLVSVALSGVFLLLAVPATRGQLISPVGQSRFINVYGFFYTNYVSGTDTAYGFEQGFSTNATDFGTFNVSTNLGNSFNGASSIGAASQNSSMTSTSITAIGTSFNAGSRSPGAGLGDTEFSLIFNLTSSVNYTLNAGLNGTIDPFGGGANFGLSGPSGIIVQEFGGFGHPQSYSYSGTLDAGQYTLVAGADADGEHNSSGSYDVVFSVMVPEPSAVGLTTLAIGILGVFWRPNKRA